MIDSGVYSLWRSIGRDKWQRGIVKTIDLGGTIWIKRWMQYSPCSSLGLLLVLRINWFRKLPRTPFPSYPTTCLWFLVSSKFSFLSWFGMQVCQARWVSFSFFFFLVFFFFGGMRNRMEENSEYWATYEERWSLVNRCCLCNEKSKSCVHILIHCK